MNELIGLTQFEKVLVTASRVFPDLLVSCSPLYGGLLSYMSKETGFLVSVTCNAVIINKQDDQGEFKDDTQRIMFYSDMAQLGHLLKTAFDMIKDQGNG